MSSPWGAVHTALDFETANNNRHSICAAGITILDGDKPVYTNNWIIKPHATQGFAKRNIEIHGITREAVENAPEFDKVYSLIKSHISGKIIIAHNASFDVDALTHTLSLYNIPIPEFEYLCSLHMAKAVWPKLSAYNLHEICSFLDIKLEHHEAGSDSHACAEIISRIMEEKHETDLRRLSEICRVKIGKINANTEIKIVEKWNKSHNKNIDISKIKPENVNIDRTNPLFGRHVAFTGDLKSMGRKDAMQKVVNLGGIIEKNPVSHCDYLVTGGEITLKVRHAQGMNAKGKSNIRIINEEEFFKLLNNT